jgi:hypothetical protein
MIHPGARTHTPAVQAENRRMAMMIREEYVHYMTVSKWWDRN